MEGGAVNGGGGVFGEVVNGGAELGEAVKT